MIEMMTKLTLSVKPTVIVRAKEFARQRGSSVSSMVEAYLASLTAETQVSEMPPVLRSVRGVLKDVDASDYRAKKYR